MPYPEEFKERVKKAYPNATELHEALDADKDDWTVKSALRFENEGTVSAERLLEATSLAEVHQLANEALEKERIYYHYIWHRAKWFEK